MIGVIITEGSLIDSDSDIMINREGETDVPKLDPKLRWPSETPVAIVMRSPSLLIQLISFGS